MSEFVEGELSQFSDCSGRVSSAVNFGLENPKQHMQGCSSPLLITCGNELLMKHSCWLMIKFCTWCFCVLLLICWECMGCCMRSFIYLLNAEEICYCSHRSSSALLLVQCCRSEFVPSISAVGGVEVPILLLAEAGAFTQLLAQAMCVVHVEALYQIL
ncbi:hypothetical protein Nepgr_002670 [Nepenthes gracilis]|uniref:Uncharacterized protein n=1 Tax=Nepenthes gracilis TaxID=150966 RepID=A0AAD3RYE4_NEPGR|nr:hypothetical protein Nepgr_002670 [Nepenthes gracilis]